MSAAQSPAPDFIIIGAMKCATSTLHEQLAAQDGVFMSTPKEPCFFSDDGIWSKGEKWYASLFDGAAPGELRGESSTHYTKLPVHTETVARMQQLLSDQVRFIYIIRHPIDRLISQYIHEWTQRLVDDCINEAVDEFSPLIDYSRYAMQVAPYLDAFGANRVMPVFFERLVANPQEQLDRIATFVGYRSTMTWQEQIDRENVSGERIRKSSLRRLVASVPGLRPLLHATTSKSFRESMKSPWKMERRPVLSVEVHGRLVSEFDEDLANLDKWLRPWITNTDLLPITCERFKEIAASDCLGDRARTEAMT